MLAKLGSFNFEDFCAGFKVLLIYGVTSINQLLTINH